MAPPFTFGTTAVVSFVLCICLLASGVLFPIEPRSRVSSAGADGGRDGRGSGQKRGEVLGFGCALSTRESAGFFCESDAQWLLRRKRVVYQQRRQEISTDSRGQAFFQKNWEPNFSCIGLTRVGNPGDGGKWVCDPGSAALRAADGRKCLVYSIGSSDMYGFEDDMHLIMPQCDIHIFDHTVASPKPPAFASFHALGLGATDDGKVLKLASLQARLGHSGMPIEVLKVDCDGCEYEALFSMLPELTNVRQLLIELHWRRSGIPSIELHAFFNAMFVKGWVIFSKEANFQWASGEAIEYSFLKLQWDAPELLRESQEDWCVGGWTSGDIDYIPANMAICRYWAPIA